MRKKITFRRLRQICVSDFGQNITSSLDLNFDRTADAMTEAYDTGLRRIVDHHALLRETIVTMRPGSPWYTDEPGREKRSETAKIAYCGNDQKQLFHITKNLMGNNSVTKLPSYVSPGDIAQRVGDYFNEKINDIRETIGSRRDNRSDAVVPAISDNTGFCCVPLTRFASVYESDVMRLFAVALCKSWEQDTVPTWLLKQCSSQKCH